MSAHRPRNGVPTIHLPVRQLGHGDLVPYAYAVARRAHAGQKDKAGMDYIEHPMRLVARLSPHRNDDAYLAVAWLHDVVEDSTATLDDLRRIGFPSKVVKAVNAVTRRPRERDPLAYYKRVSQNKIALAVKLADIEDNSDPARLALLPPDVASRLAAKYGMATALLAELGLGQSLPGRPGRPPGRRVGSAA